MIKFKITSNRFSEACSILDYMAARVGNQETLTRLQPRFVLDKDGEYIVKVKLDDDGDIESLDGIAEALLMLSNVTPKRLEKLNQELCEAAKSIVNPTSAGGSNGRTSTDTEKPPDG